MRRAWVRRGADRRLRVASGHPAPLRVGENGVEICEQSRGIPIGAYPKFEYTESRLTLRKGDRLLLFTDGATEVLNESEDMLGVDRLLERLKRQQSLDPDSALDELMADLRRWSGSHDLDDDITLLSLDVTAD